MRACTVLPPAVEYGRPITCQSARSSRRRSRRRLRLGCGGVVTGSPDPPYLRKKALGKTAKQALVVVAVKLLHALYAMLKHRQPYNPSRLLVAPATIGS
jgi:hypothetical protein